MSPSAGIVIIACMVLKVAFTMNSYTHLTVYVNKIAVLNNILLKVLKRIVDQETWLITAGMIHILLISISRLICPGSLLDLKTKVCAYIQRCIMSQCYKLMISYFISALHPAVLQHISVDKTMRKSYARCSNCICTSTPIMVPPIQVPTLQSNVTVEGDVIEENRRLTERILCIHCKTRNREVIYIPCGHYLYCSICDNLKYHRNCPLCRARIKGSVLEGQ